MMPSHKHALFHAYLFCLSVVGERRKSLQQQVQAYFGCLYRTQLIRAAARQTVTISTECYQISVKQPKRLHDVLVGWGWGWCSFACFHSDIFKCIMALAQ